MPNFKPNPNGMKPSGFKMKNSALYMSAKTGSPMQSNYKASPVKVIPVVLAAGKAAVVAAKVAKAAKVAAAAAKVAKVAKAGGAVAKAAKGANAIAKAGKAAKGAVEVASTAKGVGGFKGIMSKVKGIAGKAKAAYDKGGMVKTVVDAAAEGAVGNIMSPKENEETASITGDQKSIM